MRAAKTRDGVGGLASQYVCPTRVPAATPTEPAGLADRAAHRGMYGGWTPAHPSRAEIRHQVLVAAERRDVRGGGWRGCGGARPAPRRDTWAGARPRSCCGWHLASTVLFWDAAKAQAALSHARTRILEISVVPSKPARVPVFIYRLSAKAGAPDVRAGACWPYSARTARECALAHSGYARPRSAYSGQYLQPRRGKRRIRLMPIVREHHIRGKRTLEHSRNSMCERWAQPAAGERGRRRTGNERNGPHLKATMHKRFALRAASLSLCKGHGLHLSALILVVVEILSVLERWGAGCSGQRRCGGGLGGIYKANTGGRRWWVASVSVHLRSILLLLWCK